MIERLKYIASFFLFKTTFGELALNKVVSKSSSGRNGFTRVAIWMLSSMKHAFSISICSGWIKGSHKSGTDRCYEAYCKIGDGYDVVVNIQGDEPFIQPEIYDL